MRYLYALGELILAASAPWAYSHAAVHGYADGESGREFRKMRSVCFVCAKRVVRKMRTMEEQDEVVD
jgi:hypothetical protein